MNKLEAKIDKYLSGLMTEAESTAFEKEIATDKNLQKQIELKKDLYQFFKTRNAALNENLNRLGEQYFKNDKPKKTTYNKRLLLIATIVSILIVGFVIYQLNKPTSSNSEDTSFQKKKNLPENIQNLEIEEIPIIEQEQQEEQQKGLEIPTFNPQQKVEQPAEENNQPIAKTDKYKENPILESLIRENIRSTSVNYAHKKPKKGKIYPQKNDNTINLNINGIIDISETVELTIYNNNENRFNKDVEILSAEIKPVKVNTDEFKLSFNANISLEKGLYYYLIKIKKTKKILFVSKFMVK